MSSEWPPSEKLTIAPGLQVDFLPRGMVQITEQMALANNAQVGFPIEAAELLAKTLFEMERGMETPKYCLEAVAIWGRVKIIVAPVEAFCAYGATEYGTDSAIIAKADAIIAEAQRKSDTIIAEVLRQVAAAIAEAKFAAAMAQVAALN